MKWNVSQFILLVASLCGTSLANANPELTGVTAGSATVTQTTTNTTINQSSDKAIIEWRSFNIGAKEQTHFNQPAGGMTLNRIDATQGASSILGKLTATGQIILVNPAGITFGSGATVNVGGLVATTSNITDANFLSGQFIFDGPSGFTNAKIVNQGIIKAAQYGLVALVGSSVENSGMIQAELGAVVLGSGEKFTLTFDDNRLIHFTVDAPTNQVKIENIGSIAANGGRILMHAQSAQTVLDNVINIKGIVQADAVMEKNGEIILMANTGGISVKGKMSAAGKKAGTNGGSIYLSADKIRISDYDHASMVYTTTTSNTNKAMLDVSSVGGLAGTITLAANDISLESALLSAAASRVNSIGGTIQLLSKQIDIKTSVISTRSDLGGGFVQIGMDEFAPDISNTSVSIKSGSEIDASATGAFGVGGFILTRAENVDINGFLMNTGNGVDGFGGLVVVSGTHINLGANSKIDVGGQLGGGAIKIGTNLSLPLLSPTDDITVAHGSTIDIRGKGQSGFGGSVTMYAQDMLMNGKIDASAKVMDGFGGSVVILADNTVHLGSKAVIEALGNAGGGFVQIGGSLHGGGLEPNAQFTILDAGSLINASALQDGLGGTVVVWSDNTTTFKGSIFAKGGAIGGDGGLVQVVGMQQLINTGTINVSAPNGNPGTILFVP